MLASAVICHARRIYYAIAGPHMVHRRPCQVEHRKNVCPERAFYDRKIYIFEVSRMLLGGVVDQNVQVIKTVQSSVYRFGAESRIPDVPRDEETFPALFPDKVLCLPRILLFGFEVHDCDIGGFPGKTDGYRPSDAGVTACYERHLGEVCHFPGNRDV